MPNKVKESGRSQADPKLHVPFNNRFDNRNIPFIVYLECKEYSGKSRKNKSYRQDYIPQLFMKMSGEKIIPVKKVTEQIEYDRC